MTAHPDPAPLRLGTRASALALAQSGQAGRALVAGTGRAVELVHVRTTGDVDRRPLTQIGGTGVFVTAVRQALLDGEVDVVVHSCKDLPTTPADGITMACIPARQDLHDALVARDAEGEVLAWDYARETVVLRHFVREHRDKIADLEARIAELESALL